jgi:hypothetical protein
MFQLGLEPTGPLFELSKTKCTLHCTATVFVWILFSWIFEARGLIGNALSTCNAELTVITYIVCLHVKFYATFFQHTCLQSCWFTDWEGCNHQGTCMVYPVSVFCISLVVSADRYFLHSSLFRMLLFLFFVLVVPFMFLSF